MNLYVSILVEFLLISTSILLLFRFRNKLGLAPLYILLGAVQYVQALSGTMIGFKAFGVLTIYPGSVILFSAVLFAVLLIYIKEGVTSARALIIGIFISNFLLSAIFGITYLQETASDGVNAIDSTSVFLINYKYFITGTMILLLDFILLVIMYQFLITKISKSYYFLIILISLTTVLLFDSIAFNLALKFNSENFANSILSHMVGKSISALIFSTILYVYLKHMDSADSEATFIANQNKDIFSIIRYRQKYNNFKGEKDQVEKKLVSQIEVTLNNISDGFVSLDSNWRYTYINEKAADFLGKSSEELLGKHIWTVFPEGIDLPFYKAYHEAFETQKTVYFEDHYEPFDKWFENRIYPSPEGLTIYFTDITEKKKADANKQILLSLIETSDDFIGLASLDGKPIYLNTNGRSLTGLEENEALPDSIADFFPKKYHDKIHQDHLPSIFQNNKWNGEVEFYNFKTGDLIPIEMSGFLIKDDITNKPLALGIVASNVSARKQSEKEINEIQDKLEAAIRVGEIGYWSWDIIKDEVFWSDLMYTIYDVDKTKPLKYNSVLNRVHPDDKEFHNKLSRDRIKNKNNDPFEYRILWRDNTVKHVMVQMEVIDDIDGNAIKFQGTAIDITESKKAEEQIIKSKKYLDNIINNIGDPIFVKDDQSHVLLVNDAFCSLFGLSRADIIGKTLAENVPPQERDSFLSIDKQVIATGIENINEETLSLDKKETRTISTKKTRYIDSSGNKFIIGVIRDITERKKSELALKENEEKYSKAFDSNVIGKAILNKDKKIIEVNEALANIVGFERAYMLGKTAVEIGLFNFESEKNLENEKKLWSEFSKKGYVSNIELQYLMQSGNELFILISLQSLELNNEDHVLITILDITANKNIEAELEKYRNNLEELVELRTSQLEKEKIKAQSADLMKSAFLATMSHELRTPMNSIIGFTGILLKEFAGPLNEEQKKQLSMVKNSSQHLLGLINDILDISKIEAGKLKVSLDHFNYLVTLAKTIDFLVPQAAKKDIVIHSEISEMQILLHSDERRVEQILLNLLSNAIKFSNKGVIQVKVAIKDNLVVTQVIDQGIGISKKDLNKLFVPFIQLEAGLSRSHEGTGLGLAISKSLIEKLGGTIYVQSKKGVGSNFTFTLPLHGAHK